MGPSKNSICDFGWKAPACYLISACAFCNQLDQSLMALGADEPPREARRAFAAIGHCMVPAELK